jgi:RNA polymerase sigma-70 factor (ECF subfamily)
MTDPGVVSRFNEIYDSTNRAVLVFITAKCGRTADIADLFQDTYMELYQTLCKRGTGYIIFPKAFVMRLVRRKLAKYYEAAARHPAPVSLSEPEWDGADAFLTENFAVNGATLDAARKFLLQKPEDVKKIFYLHFELDLTIAKIAKKLSMSESNVKNKLYRTLKELRELLG